MNGNLPQYTLLTIAIALSSWNLVTTHNLVKDTATLAAIVQGLAHDLNAHRSRKAHREQEIDSARRDARIAAIERRLKNLDHFPGP